MANEICFNCANAVPDLYGERGCSWSRRFEPVEGWTATPTVISRHSRDTMYPSYKITACPEFISDDDYKRGKENDT